MKWFVEEEFECPCCKENNIQRSLLHMLDDARNLTCTHDLPDGEPFIINSGYRCPDHNAAVGGVPDSAHVKGLAADIHCITGIQRMRMIKALIDAGFDRIGIDKSFIHVDIDMTKPLGVLFLY